MQIFVINLEKDVLRRDSVKRQLDQLQLPFEFIPGVLGSALSATQLAECYDDRKARWNNGVSLVPAHIGCSLSHTRVYQEIVRRQLDCTLILEDDVVLPDSLPGCLANLQKLVQKESPEVILLSPAEGMKGPYPRQAADGAFEIVPYKDGFFANSYIVTQTAAQALLKELYPVGDVADCWKRLKRYRVVDLYVMLPALIVQDQGSFGSSTNADTWKKGKLTGWGKLLHKSRRAATKFLDLFYGLYRRLFVPYAGIKLPSDR